MRIRPILCTVATAATLVVAVPTAAQAVDAPSPTTAAQRCVSGFTHDSVSVLHMDGGRGKAYPEGSATLRPGDVLRIEPVMTDLISYSLWASATYTPAGVQPAEGAPVGWPAPGLNRMGLFGVFGGFSPIFLGQSSTCLSVPQTTDGKLTLAVNDPETWDNQGAWNVIVRVYRSPVLDGGFEQQRSRTVGAPWFTEGTEAKGVDINLGLARSGRNNAWIRTSGTAWNAFLQTVPVRPFATYRLRGFVRTSGNVNTAFFGARLSGEWPPREVHFGPHAGYQQLDVVFNAGNRTSVTIFVGFWGVGSDAWIQADDIVLLST